MDKNTRNNMSREDRLAARLRDNLRRRKAQARAMNNAPADSDAVDATESLPNPPHES
ncbi:hypothetical protein [Erythrobacter sp. R86502]|uniref:hypothetical protein n=1 Tax=Erythrobacter sp. R86502 TaxID=3093846 RepID=UPI0036D2AEC8